MLRAKPEVECIANVSAILGEGPVWVAAERAIYWVDILGKRLFRWSANEDLRTLELQSPLCSIAPRAGGGYIGAGFDGFVFISPDYQISQCANPESAWPGNRFNDGKVDRAGRFWAGTMDRTEQQATGSLYRLDPDMSWHRMDSGYRITNGPAFSVDGTTIYHTDSALQRIYAFDVDAEGALSGKRTFAQFGEGDGYPDGMTVDADDCLWVAFWGGWCVRRLSPAGEIIGKLDLPVQCPTSCTFGGEDLDQLFITSASRDLTAQDRLQQPHAGGLFRCNPGVRGVAELLFAA